MRAGQIFFRKSTFQKIKKLSKKCFIQDFIICEYNIGIKEHIFPKKNYIFLLFAPWIFLNQNQKYLVVPQGSRKPMTFHEIPKKGQNRPTLLYSIHKLRNSSSCELRFKTIYPRLSVGFTVLSCSSLCHYSAPAPNPLSSKSANVFVTKIN